MKIHFNIDEKRFFLQFFLTILLSLHAFSSFTYRLFSKFTLTNGESPLNRPIPILPKLNTIWQNDTETNTMREKNITTVKKYNGSFYTFSLCFTQSLCIYVHVSFKFQCHLHLPTARCYLYGFLYHSFF